MSTTYSSEMSVTVPAVFIAVKRVSFAEGQSVNL